MFQQANIFFRINNLSSHNMRASIVFVSALAAVTARPLISGLGT